MEEMKGRRVRIAGLGTRIREEIEVNAVGGRRRGAWQGMRRGQAVITGHVAEKLVLG